MKPAFDPLLPAGVGEARSLIHDALEFLYSRGGEPLEALDFRAAFGATDTLLDIEEALYAFEKEEWPSGLGTSYLLTIGTLQALVIQQDATRVLCKVFGLTFRPDSNDDLRRIREMRVRVAGHPARHGERKKKKEIGSTMFVRQTFTKESAKVVTYFHDPSGIEHNEINLVALYTLQQKLICRSLRLVWGKILHSYPEAAHFRWQPWLATEHYPLRAGIKIMLESPKSYPA